MIKMKTAPLTTVNTSCDSAAVRCLDDSSISQTSEQDNGHRVLPVEAHPSARRIAGWENQNPQKRPLTFPLTNDRTTCHPNNKMNDQLEKGIQQHAARQDGNNKVPKRSINGGIIPVSAFSMLQRRKQEQNSVRNLYLIPPQVSDINSQSYNSDSAWLKLGLGITELAGEAGSGKSQMAMSLCVHAALNSQKASSPPGTRAIYISLSGGNASVSRLAQRMQQMVEAEEQHRSLQQQQRHYSTNLPQNTNDNEGLQANQRPAQGENHPVLSQILTRSVRNQDDLLDLLRKELPEILEHQRAMDTTSSIGEGVSLIVLDSIADLFRLGNGEESPKDSSAISKRSLVLFELASCLKQLSSHYNMPVLVINQISTNLETNSAIPTLGLSWENCVNTSYLMRRQRVLQEQAGKFRQLFLTKSAFHAIDQRATFQIEPRGIAAVTSSK